MQIRKSRSFCWGQHANSPESKCCYWCPNTMEVNGRGGDGWILVAGLAWRRGKSGWLLPHTGSCCETSFHSCHGGRISHVMAEAWLLFKNKTTLGRLPPGASTPSGSSALDGGYREWCPARRHTPSTWARRPGYAKMEVLLGGVFSRR